MSKLHKISDHLYVYHDICNVYVIKEGNAALLIDAGSGSVLDQLDAIGCKQIEWVLHTHHHRDQCWGDRRLIESGAKIAVPSYERYLFEDAELFWRTRRIFDNYNDRNTFFTIDRNISAAATLDDYESFEWRGHSFFGLPAKGHTLGSVGLVTEIDGRLMAFSGDLLAKGGVLYQLHAMEYGYGDMIGALFTLQSIQALRKCLTGGVIAGRTLDSQVQDISPVILPSHGDVIDDPVNDIDRLEQRLMDLVALGRGLRVGGDVIIPEENYLPEPKFVDLSEHLLWGGAWTCSNFYVLLSKSGKAMFIDYGHSFAPHMHVSREQHGLETMRFIEHHLDELRDAYGISSFDLVVPTHIHDDHTCGIPHLQRFYDTSCWALREVGEILADPAAWTSTPCTFPKTIRIDRWLSDGESFNWEEYSFDVHFAPGQTEFHSVLAATIDGRKVAFTGDNVFLHEVLLGGQVEVKPYQTTVLRNSFQLGMHRRCAEVMRKVAPELICPGHRDVIPCDKTLMDGYSDFIARKERAFRNLVAEPADHYIDLFWARMVPFVAQVQPGAQMQYRLLLRNNLQKSATYEARLLPPDGWHVRDDFTSIKLDAGHRGEMQLTATAPDGHDRIRRLMTAEIRIDGTSQGPIAEALVTVQR